MKKQLFFTLLMVYTVGLIAQTPITFNKVKYYFGDSLNSSGLIKSIETLDSNYFLGVDAYSDTLLFTSYIVKTDLYGNKIAQSPRFGSDSVAYFIATGNGMIIDEDSNIIVAGEYIEGQWGGFAIKLDRNMDTIWTMKYRFPDSLVNYAYTNPRHLFKAIEQTLDGNYIIMGSYFIDSNYYYTDMRAYLIKLDKSGNVIWRKTYPNYSPIYDIAVTSDSGFVFSVTRNSFYGSYICKTDSIGNMLWFKQQCNSIFLNSNDITVSGDDIVSIVPYDYSGTSDPSSLMWGLNITKTSNISGQIIWTKRYRPMITIKCPTLHEHIEVEIDANEDIIIAATGRTWNYDSTAASYKGFILKLNSNGDSLWSKFYDWGDFFQRDAQFNDLVLTDDGGILAGGFWTPPYLNYKQGAWLVKVDSMGNAPGAYTIGIEENELIIKNNEFKIYPNPATENINIGFEKCTNEIIELLIYSSSGAIVKQQQLQADAQKHRIDIQGLCVGVYVVKLVSAEGVVYSSKFIKK